MVHTVILQNDVKIYIYSLLDRNHITHKNLIRGKTKFSYCDRNILCIWISLKLFHHAITPRPQRARWIYSIRYFSSPFQRMNPTPLKLKKHCNLQVITCCYNDKNCHLPTQDRNKTQIKLFWREIKFRNYNMHRTTWKDFLHVYKSYCST